MAEPTVVAALSGNHCLSVNCRRRLLLPTEVFPIRRSLQSTTDSAAAIDEDEGSVADNLISPAPSLERPAVRCGHVRVCDRKKPAAALIAIQVPFPDSEDSHPFIHPHSPRGSTAITSHRSNNGSLQDTNGNVDCSFDWGRIIEKPYPPD